MNGRQLTLNPRLIIANLALGLVMFVVAQNTQATTTSTAPASNPNEATIVAKAEDIKSTSKIQSPTEAAIKEKFKEHPLLVDIVRCESRFTQFNTDGSLLRGVVNSKDVGVMQINEHYHLERSKSLGMDIHTLEGNMEYGLYLFERQGSQPWSASAPCWGKPIEVALVN